MCLKSQISAMQQIILIIILVIIQSLSFGQSIEKVYPKILFSSTDTFFIQFSNYPKKFSFQISKRDTIDMGTDGDPGLNATIYYGTDSLAISYNNLPYRLIYYIPIQSPKGKTIYRLHFNSVTSKFPSSYMDRNKGNVQIEIPEVYELA